MSSLFAMKVSVVPVRDVKKVFTPGESKIKKLEVDQWVRIKRHVYGGDLGRVVEVYDGTNEIIVKLVPRLRTAD